MLLNLQRLSNKRIQRSAASEFLMVLPMLRAAPADARRYALV